MQSQALMERQVGRRKKLVIFFIPGIQRVTGGVLQIFSLHRMTRELLGGVDTDTLICWLPGEGWDSHHFDGFSNDVTVFPLEMVLDTIATDCELMFHLPEYATAAFIKHVGMRRLARLRAAHRLRINILNQNIESMAAPRLVAGLKRMFPDLCCTAGNPAWATEEEQRRLNIPIHVLPTWYYPDDAPWLPYEAKRNLMIVSPDRNPHRERVLGAIGEALPDLEIKVIQGLKYEQYLEFERAAKWSLTFGEGLDGYFYGPVLRGGISFAVSNGTFDLPGLETIRTAYADYEVMAARIAADIRDLDSKERYEAYNRTVREPFLRAFGRERTATGLSAFYREAWGLL